MQKQRNNSPKSKQQQDHVTFCYQLLAQANYKHPDDCCAISISPNNNLLICSAYESIKVLQFKNGSLQYLQQINKHHENITTLNFFRRKMNFLSSSCDGSMIIWSSSLISSLKFITKLNAHSDQINCVVVTSNLQDDLIISGSFDQTIKFWSPTCSLPSSWSCIQTIHEHTSLIYGLSINEDGNKLISCGYDELILVIEKSNNNIWEVKQKIKVDVGFRLAFITSNIFVFQPYKREQLNFYTYDQLSQQYIQSKTLSIKGSGQKCQQYFPQMFIPSKQILVSKNGHAINFIMFHFISSVEWECNLKYVISFDQCVNGLIFGTVSENGEFLITWDQKSEQIQIRQFKCLL
ncbi:unnamed protein product (macronuclear) [Paramecium tetraurelia]|uniref:Uncharacterized protein n=1 Tax=Paramecium tetraurelia TaxID=5888 RepID=A0C8B2_PARTE|nr:uncharacterized protein GSPATT00036161001 [Paramecium tetraurelia]CAK67029.1 unnamed protein product [Paramecium tetraurelia]|eukprot:XP_001434426.1 hypothetical protein (macronuclear) [Paramecium tetraurelia strain d4-2]